MSANKPILWNYFRSSASWRVRNVLEYKGIEFEYRVINLQKKDHFTPEFIKINPFSQVPAFSHNGKILTQSMAIVEYLEELHPEKPLLPKDPLARARVRQICEIIGAGIQPLQNPSVAALIPDKDWPNKCIGRGFTALEKLLEETSGKYCVGDEVTLADCFLIPQVYNASRFNADTSKFPRIMQINGRLQQLEPFKRANAFVQSDCPEDMRVK